MKLSPSVIVEFLKFEVLLANRVKKANMPNAMPNLLRSVKMLQIYRNFLDFQIGGCLPSQIFNNLKF